RIAPTGSSDIDDLPAAGTTDPVAGAIWSISGSELHRYRLREHEWTEDVPSIDASDVVGSSAQFGLSAADLEDDSLVAVTTGGSLVLRIPSHMTRSRLVASFAAPVRPIPDP